MLACLGSRIGLCALLREQIRRVIYLLRQCCKKSPAGEHSFLQMATHDASYEQVAYALPVSHSPRMLPPNSKALNKPAVGFIVFPAPSAKRQG